MDDRKTLYDKWIEVIRNNKIAVFAIIVSGMVVGASSLLDAGIKFRNLITGINVESLDEDSMLVQSPWVEFRGYKYLFGDYSGFYGGKNTI